MPRISVDPRPGRATQRVRTCPVTEIDDRSSKDATSRVGAQPRAAAEVEKGQAEFACLFIRSALAGAVMRPSRIRAGTRAGGM